MHINRTGPRNTYIDDLAPQADRTAPRFQNAAAAPATTAPAGVSAADLQDPQKADEIVRRSFGDLVDKAGRLLGAPLPDAARRGIADFLGNDPVMRGKLLDYLHQVVK